MLAESPAIFVDGRRASDGGATLDVVDPATGAPFGAIVRGGPQEVDRAVRSAHATFASDAWRRMPAADRGRILARIAESLRAHEEELARLEARDVGKPVTQARNDVRGTARYFEYYGGMADKVGGETIPVRWGALDLTVREPYGVAAQIIPWNFPLLMGGRGIAPALAAGNCVVAKPAEDASLGILRLAELAAEAGLPAGAFNVVTGLGSEAGAALVRHPLVRHVTFTGSVATGKAIMQMAAEGIKPVALELGGKSPNIVFADADLAAAAELVVRASLYNAGQVCNGCPRLLVARAVRDALVDAVAQKYAAMRLGDPLDDPDLGPLNSARHRDKVENAIAAAGREGATVERYAAAPADARLAGGFFARPAIVTGVSAQHRVFHEEIFGPVLTVTVFDDVDEAIALANATEYGLNAGVFTRDLNTAMVVAQRLEAGQVYINGWGTGGGVEVPFGGYKHSGFGREKGFAGLLHYTQVKSITAHYV
jgi:acyl-CoA reductase-like NAD-dependent aldehyde dehydrogenase